MRSTKWQPFVFVWKEERNVPINDKNSWISYWKWQSKCNKLHVFAIRCIRLSFYDAVAVCIMVTGQRTPNTGTYRSTSYTHGKWFFEKWSPILDYYVPYSQFTDEHTHTGVRAEGRQSIMQFSWKPDFCICCCSIAGRWRFVCRRMRLNLIQTECDQRRSVARPPNPYQPHVQLICFGFFFFFYLPFSISCFVWHSARTLVNVCALLFE